MAKERVCDICRRIIEGKSYLLVLDRVDEGEIGELHKGQRILDEETCQSCSLKITGKVNHIKDMARKS